MPGIKDYFDALERLQKDKPVIVPKGTKINNDSVSLEAGRKKGSIKRARPIFHRLIAAINAAANGENMPNDAMKERLDAALAESKRNRKRWEEAMAREVSLVKQLWDEREAWAKERASLTGGKVTPIR